MIPKENNSPGRPRTEDAGVSERVTITLPPSLLERIDQLAKANGQSRSYVIRRCTEESLPSFERIAKTLSSPSILGGFHRFVVDLLYEARADPERSDEITEAVNSFRSKAKKTRSQGKTNQLSDVS